MFLIYKLFWGFYGAILMVIQFIWFVCEFFFWEMSLQHHPGSVKTTVFKMNHQMVKIVFNF